jgi:hypothetical protein
MLKLQFCLALLIAAVIVCMIESIIAVVRKKLSPIDWALLALGWLTLFSLWLFMMWRYRL